MGLSGVSWGLLGGPLEGLFAVMLSSAILGRVRSPKITGSKPAILLLFLDPEANFRCKNTMILLNLGSLGLAGVRVNKMSESLERNQRFCCRAGGVKSREEERHNCEVCKVKATRRLAEQVNLQNCRFA